MRPVPSGSRPLNPQPPGRPDTLGCGPSTTPMACFITNEASLEAGPSRSPPRLRQQVDHRKCQTGSHHPSSSNQQHQATASPAPTSRSDSSSSGEDQDPLTYPSHPGTPLFLGLSGPESALSSTSSRRSSIAGPSVDHHSEPIEISAVFPEPAMSEVRDNDSSVPQLIMPSLTVPRRRPFSNVGKSLGKLKIMVAGRPGIGKTSLIMSLAQRCEHIVHMDQMEHVNANVTPVAEIYASSRPHPWWKTDSHLSFSGARRRSLSTYEVLDRNVCFVESRGRSSSFSGSSQDLHYIKSCLAALLAKPMDDSDLFSLLNAGGESIVDVLLYLVPNKGLEDSDVEYMKHAQQMTNVIPLLARVDELGDDEVDVARQELVRNLNQAGLECFSFANPDQLTETSQVYAVSTETRIDYETMDASILMNSEYIPPLVPTDLSRLVDHIFSLDGSAQLRYKAARKAVGWRHNYGYGALQVALQKQSLIPRNYLRLAPMNRTQCWERLEIYNWANNLRQSLHAERLRHFLNDKSRGGPPTESRLVAITSSVDDQSHSKTNRDVKRRHQDPLGILEIGGQLKQKGILALEMITSIGLIGYVVTRIVHADWTEETCSAALAGSRRIGLEVPGLGTLLFW